MPFNFARSPTQPTDRPRPPASLTDRPTEIDRHKDGECILNPFTIGFTGQLDFIAVQMPFQGSIRSDPVPAHLPRAHGAQ